LAREQHLSQLDGLAAAAAHELGTPLSTITVVIREIERALEKDSPYADDVKLLREQAQRCREILAKITELPAGEPFDRLPLSALIEEAVAPHRNFGVSIIVAYPPNRAGEPASRAAARRCHHRSHRDRCQCLRRLRLALAGRNRPGGRKPAPHRPHERSDHLRPPDRPRPDRRP
jgi:signal transduction histidine kinase